MSTYYFCHSNKKTITLAESPFAGGGEGELYHVVQPHSKSWVAKIYHPSKRSAQKASKMLYLKQHPPFGSEKQGAWIIEVLEDRKGNFVGVLMPFQGGKKLEMLCGLQLPKKVRKSWQPLAFGQPYALEARFHLGLQLAAAVAQLHESQQYILVDLKPDNVLVQAYRQLSLVDLDSVAVVQQGNLQFPASVATPEYAPPEYHQDSPALFPSWDNFSLAVILYKLFCGIHPYAATAGKPYEQANSLGDKVKHGLFVHSPSKRPFFKVIPPPHAHFEQLPSSLQQLFVQCFEQGHQQPHTRPKASAWCWALLEVLGKDKLTQEFRELLSDGWESPRQALSLPSTLLYQQKQREIWGPLTPPAPVAVIKEYKEGKALLKQLEEESDSWKNPTYLFMGVAVVCLITIVALVEYYTPQAQLVVFGLVMYLARKIYVFYKNSQQKRALKKELQQYHQQAYQAQEGWQWQQQVWEEWRAVQKKQVQTALDNLEALIKEKDQEVEALKQQCQKAYQGVLEDYQKNLQPLSLPPEWQEYAWNTIVQLLEQQQQQQEQAITTALGNPAAQQAYQVAVKKAEEQLQQLEQQLLDEAKVLFNWEAFFDKEESGLPWKDKALLHRFQEEQVPHLLALEQISWTATGNLQVQTAQQTFVLEKQLYQQLEIFYEAYQWYAAPLEFASTHQLDTAPAFLRARFKVLQVDYHQQLQTLKEEYRAHQDRLQAPHQQALILTKWQLEQLQGMLAERQAALLEVEQNYQQLYLPIYQATQELLQARLTILTEYKENSMAYWEQLEGENSLIETSKLLKKQEKVIQNLL